MKPCSKCKNLCSTEQFVKDGRKAKGRRSYCYSCKYKAQKTTESEETKEWRRSYNREYHKKNPLNAKVKAYQHHDKVLNMPTISLGEVRDLLERNNSCYYCASKEQLGLDRKDNTKGHEVSNVVVCCEKCNNILSDLPQEAKEIMKPALSEIFKKGFLEQWTIPTKRKPRGAE